MSVISYFFPLSPGCAVERGTRLHPQKQEDVPHQPTCPHLSQPPTGHNREDASEGKKEQI